MKNGLLPAHLIEQVKASRQKVPIDIARRIVRHVTHLERREQIRVDFPAMKKRIESYSKKGSGTSQFVAGQYKRIVDDLVIDQHGYWHFPYVSAFHSKTGRDHTLGAALNQVPKEYWKSVLNPPKGSVYALLDYQQQEPMIAAYMSNCQILIDWYGQGDIYEQLALRFQDKVTREQCKGLMIGHLYGIGVKTLSEQLKVSIYQARTWLTELSQFIYPIEQYLNQSASEIRASGVARSLDWQYTISDLDSELSLRNWKIQATGADIMRRVCINLDHAEIPLLLTNHDSFLVRLEIDNYQIQLNKAIQALTDAAVDVLNGFPLKVAVEMQVPSKEK